MAKGVEKQLEQNDQDVIDDLVHNVFIYKIR